MVKISVIIAAYNSEKYIREAVASVQRQTLRELEILCVDDCSQDATPRLLDELAAEDSRVRVIHHTVNGGTAKSRYDGLCAASGEYILFLDGDDYYTSPRACETLYTAAAEKEVDVLQFGMQLLAAEDTPQDYLQGLTQTCRPCTVPLPHQRGALVDECCLKRRFGWNLAGKLFSADCLRQAHQFYQGTYLTMAEDMLFCFLALVWARGYAALEEPFYAYRLGSGITSRRQLSPEGFRPYIQEYQVYALLKSWLERLGLDGRYRLSLQFVRDTVAQDMSNAFLNRLHEEDCPQALEQLLTQWPSEDAAAALSDSVYRRGLCQPDAAAWRCRTIGGSAAAGRPIRTVGTFYYRMYNGGVERVISLLAALWQKQGWRVVLFTEEAPNALDYPLPENVIRVLLPRLDSNDPNSFYARAAAWKKGLADYSVDVMVYHAWLYNFLVADELSIRSTGVPLALHTHGLFSIGLSLPLHAGGYQTATQAKTYCLSNLIIALSEVDRAWWRALGLCCEATLNPPTFDIHRIAPAPADGQELLWVGRICAQKQPEEALAIMRLVHEQLPAARLHMVGAAETEEEMARFQAEIDREGLQDCMVLEGYQTDVAPFYRQAAAVLWTAAFEGAPMAMIESKAFGLPIVAYELANVDMVRQAKGMVVVPQKARRQAAQQLVRLLQDDAARHALAQQARESAVEMAQTDLGAHWQRLLALAVQPQAEHTPLYRLPPLESAVQLSMDFLAEGMRSGALADGGGANALALAQQNAAYAVMVDEIRHSTSYRLGEWLTAVPRRCKRWLQKRLRRT